MKNNKRLVNSYSQNLKKGLLTQSNGGTPHHYAPKISLIEERWVIKIECQYDISTAQVTITVGKSKTLIKSIINL